MKLLNRLFKQEVTVAVTHSGAAGAVLRWGRGAQAPQMLARPSPPKYFGSNSKIRIVKI